MSDWPECEFIVADPAEGAALESLDRTGWETVVFVVEDEEHTPSKAGVATR